MFDSDLKNSVNVFEVAQLFLPSKISEMNVTAESLEKLSIIPFITTSIRENMKKELSTYVAVATGVDASVNVLEWWEKHSTELSMWADVVQDIVLLQPTSVAAERVLSILKSSLVPQQNHTHQDYVPSKAVRY